MHCTVVGLSTTPAFLIIFHFFQIQNFMVLQQAFSYKKYMFSKRSGSKSFWSQKMAIFDICFFKFHYIKSTFYNPKQLANGQCQVIYLLKKSTFHFIKLLIAVDSKFRNDAATSPSGKK